MPDFSCYNIPKREKYTKEPQSISNRHKIYRNCNKMYQMDIKYSNVIIAKPSKIYPNLKFFWFENMPSGSPDGDGKT
jgi:hypothetical protein